ncbi:hypothetical protein [Devosia sp. DBB001]|nr:hypothetical protein [Devosia sp. DBB001]
MKLPSQLDRSARRQVVRAASARRLVITKDLATEIDADLNWYALTTHPQKEYTLAHILRSLGVETFVPTQTRWRATNRHTKARRHKEEMAFAVVPRYVFAGFPGTPPWFHLSQIPLVTGVVGDKEQALRLNRFRFIEFAAAYANGALRAPVEQRHMRSREEFGVGDQVTIVSGAFRDHVVPVTQIDGDMGTVLLSLFGTEREIDLPLEYLSNAA